MHHGHRKSIELLLKTGFSPRLRKPAIPHIQTPISLPLASVNNRTSHQQEIRINVKPCPHRQNDERQGHRGLAFTITAGTAASIATWNAAKVLSRGAGCEVVSSSFSHPYQRITLATTIQES